MDSYMNGIKKHSWRKHDVIIVMCCDVARYAFACLRKCANAELVSSGDNQALAWKQNDKKTKKISERKINRKKWH